MIKIYDGEVFTLDRHQYDRMDVLNMCWANSRCSSLKFLVYDGEELFGAMSYFDILNNKEIAYNCEKLDSHLFENARKYFKREENRYSCIPVLNDKNECVFLLTFQENRFYDYSRDGDLFHEYWDLDLLKDMDVLDYTLLQDAAGYVFFELEEYTYALAILIQKKYSDRPIYFLGGGICRVIF